MMQIRSLARDSARPMPSCGGARRNWRRELNSASRPSGALRHTIRRDDFAARLSAAKLLATPETCEAWPDARRSSHTDDVDVADRGLGEAAAPRRLLLGLGEPGSAVPIQAAVARYGSASSFLEWRQHGAARIARPPSAVVKRPRHLATVPDNGTVQLDRADHTRRQGATAPRTSTGRRRK